MTRSSIDAANRPEGPVLGLHQPTPNAHPRPVHVTQETTSRLGLARCRSRIRTVLGPFCSPVARSDYAVTSVHASAHVSSPCLYNLLSVLVLFGGPPGDRTRDTLIKSQVLYH